MEVLPAHGTTNRRDRDDNVLFTNSNNDDRAVKKFYSDLQPEPSNNDTTDLTIRTIANANAYVDTSVNGNAAINEIFFVPISTAATAENSANKDDTTTHTVQYINKYDSNTDNVKQ